jgi:hypothetical protein
MTSASACHAQRRLAKLVPWTDQRRRRRVLLYTCAKEYHGKIHATIDDIPTFLYRVTNTPIGRRTSCCFNSTAPLSLREKLVNIEREGHV